MNFTKEILFFFSALGAFNGFFLSLYLIFYKKNYFPNLFLGALIFSLSVRVGKSVLFYFNPELPKIYLQIGLSFCFLIGPFLYFYISSTLKQINLIPKKWKIILVSLIILIILIGIIIPYQKNQVLWSKIVIKLIYFEWSFFIVLSAIKLINFNKTLKKNSTIKLKLIWLIQIFYGNLIIFISFLLSLTLSYYPIYISSSIFFSLILYTTIFILIQNNKPTYIFSKTKIINERSIEESEIVIESLHKIIFENKLYRNGNLTLKLLSDEVNISSHQLSELLNNIRGKSFTAFINEYRINEACDLMLLNSNMSLDGIGYSVGFNSKTTFFSTFKKLKGTTPLIYQKKILLSPNL